MVERGSWEAKAARIHREKLKRKDSSTEITPDTCQESTFIIYQRIDQCMCVRKLPKTRMKNTQNY